MFMAMKSRRQSFVPPCNYQTCSCYCHKPETPEYKTHQAEIEKHDMLLILKVFGFLAIVFAGMFLLLPHQQVSKTIKVNGKTCDIVWVQEKTNGHGGTVGHEEVFCKWLSKGKK